MIATRSPSSVTAIASMPQRVPACPPRAGESSSKVPAFVSKRRARAMIVFAAPVVASRSAVAIHGPELAEVPRARVPRMAVPRVV